MRCFLTVAMVVLVLVSGGLAATNLPARVHNNTNAPAAARKPLHLVQPVVQAAPVTQMAPARLVVDEAVVALGGTFKTEGAASVPGLGHARPELDDVVAQKLGGATAAKNRVVVAGLSPAGRVMADFVREINHQQGVEDDAAFLGDVDVWRQGPLGEIVTQAMQARRRGDEEAYQAFLARYWVEYGAAIERRRVLGKMGTQRPVPGR
jgi:hypothetical protein